MLEQYLDGPEVDVDVVLNSEGDVVYGNVTDNWPTIEPYFNETGMRYSILGCLCFAPNSAADTITALGSTDLPRPFQLFTCNLSHHRPKHLHQTCSLEQVYPRVLVCMRLQ